MKKLIVTVCAALTMAFAANAQETFYPGWYFGVQGGVNYVSSNYWGLGKFQHLNPNASLNLGYDFAPWFGLRGSVSGPFGNFPTNGTTINKYNYAQFGLDAVVDICNIFKYKETRFLSPYVFLGGAAGYRFQVGSVPASFIPGVRAGLGFNFRLSELVDLSLELQDNALNNKFNTLDDNELFGGDILRWKRPFKWDDNFAALLGLKFNFGSVKAHKAAIAAAEAAAAEAAALAAAQKAAAERAAAEKAAAEKAAAEAAAAERLAAEMRQVNTFFVINSAVISDEEAAKLVRYIDWLKANPDVNVAIAGHADKGTGNARINQRLSEERAAAVKAFLLERGIAESRIVSVVANGDRVQPFAENDLNRVVISTIE